MLCDSRPRKVLYDLEVAPSSPRLGIFLLTPHLAAGWEQKRRGCSSSASLLCLSGLPRQHQRAWGLPTPWTGIHLNHGEGGIMSVCVSGHQEGEGTLVGAPPFSIRALFWPHASSVTAWHFPVHTPFGKSKKFDEPSCPWLVFLGQKQRAHQITGGGLPLPKLRSLHTISLLCLTSFLDATYRLGWFTNYCARKLPPREESKLPGVKRGEGERGRGGGAPASVRLIAINSHQVQSMILIL